MRLTLILLLSCFLVRAQQPYFSSPSQELLVINPAFAGSNNSLRVQTMGGTTGFPKYGLNQSSYYFGADRLLDKHSAIGVYAYQMNYGTRFTNQQAGFSYAYHIRLSEKVKFVPALQVSMFYLRLKTDGLSFDDLRSVRSSFAEIVPYTPPAVLIKYNMDFSAGGLMYGKNFFVGATVHSLSQPDEGLFGVSKRQMTQVYQAGYRLEVCDHFNLSTYAIAKLQGYHNSFFQCGLNPNWKYFSLHVAQRLNGNSDYNAFIAGINTNCHGMKIGYNATINYARHLNNYFVNELFLSLNFGGGCCKKKSAANASATPEAPMKLYF